MNSIDADHLDRQRIWSEKTFGPGARTTGVLTHIRKELGEIEDDPANVFEWVDVMILAFDGALRAGFDPQEIIDAYHRKMAVNESREWPDYRKFSQDEPIEHVREEDQWVTCDRQSDPHLIWRRCINPKPVVDA